MNKEYFIVILAVPIIILSSCSLAQNINDDYPIWKNDWIDSPTDISLEVIVPESVELSQSLLYKIIVTNKSEHVLQLGAAGSTTSKFDVDLIAINSSDRIVWTRFPIEATFQAIMYSIILEPGEEYFFSDEWNLVDLFGDEIRKDHYKLIAGIHGLEVNHIEITDDDQIIVTESLNYFSNVVSSNPRNITVK